jgi:hypothetical protein
MYMISSGFRCISFLDRQGSWANSTSVSLGRLQLEVLGRTVNLFTLLYLRVLLPRPCTSSSASARLPPRLLVLGTHVLVADVSPVLLCFRPLSRTGPNTDVKNPARGRAPTLGDARRLQPEQGLSGGPVVYIHTYIHTYRTLPWSMRRITRWRAGLSSSIFGWRPLFPKQDSQCYSWLILLHSGKHGTSEGS